MRLNNKEFESIPEALGYAMGLAEEAKEKYGLPVNGKNFLMSVDKVIQHIWFHGYVAGICFRLEVTPDGAKVYTWVDCKGWKEPENFKCEL